MHQVGRYKITTKYNIMQPSKWLAGVISVLLLCAHAGVLTAQPADAFKDSLLRVVQSGKADTATINALIELGYHVGATDAAAAETYARRAALLAASQKHALYRGDAAYLLAGIYVNLTRFAEAALVLDTAELIFAGIKRPDKLARVYNERGNMYYMQSNLIKAAEWYQQSAKAFGALGDTTRELIAFQNLISTVAESKQYEKAIALSQTMLQRLLAAGDTAQASRNWHTLILNYLAINRPDSASRYVRPLWQYIQHTDDRNIKAESYNIIGKWHDMMGRYDSAVWCYKKALQHVVRQNYQPAIYYLSLGATYLKMGALREAFFYLSTADSLAAVAHAPDIHYRISKQWADYYAATGNYKMAWVKMNEYALLYDSLLTAENREFTTRMEAIYETEKKEAAILKLETEKLKQALALRQRSTWLLLTGLLALAGIVTIGLLYRQQRIRRQLFTRENELKTERIATLEKERQNISLQAMIAGQEAERNRIARDLHDGLGGLFSTIKMYLSSTATQNPQLRQDELYARSMELVDQAAGDVRKIAHNLMPEVLMKLGLIQAVEGLCQQISKGGLIRVSFQAYGMEDRLTPASEVMLYRILQELLNNIMKHAGATEVIVQFNRHDDRLSVTVEDNGKGFDATDYDSKTGTGIGGIKSRVDYLNGQMNIESRMGIGTTIMMEFELTNQQS